MGYNLSKHSENDIIAPARKCGIEKVILFGSRTRGTNRKRSDIDLAIKGGDVSRFAYDVDDEVYTLLMFDIVDLGKEISAELQAEIERDGIVIYEKI